MGEHTRINGELVDRRAGLVRLLTHLWLSVLLVVMGVFPGCKSAGIDLRQVPVVEEGTGVSLGMIDKVTGNDTRIKQFQDNDYIGFDDEYYYLSNLGLTDWGVIQTSLLMKSHPKGPDFKLKTPFCSITDEATSYLLKSEFDLGNNQLIYDYEVFGDMIIVMNYVSDIVAVKLVPQIDPTGKQDPSSKLEAKFRLSGLESKSKETLGKNFKEARLAIHAASKILYIPTDLGLISLNIDTLEFGFISQEVFKPKAQIVYADIVGDYLFVGYFDLGVQVYKIVNATAVQYVGLIGKELLGIAAGSKFQMLDFIVHSYLVEVCEVHNHSMWNVKQNTKSFFKSDLTNGEIYNQITSSESRDALMFVAEPAGVHVLNLQSVLVDGKLPTKPFRHVIPVANVLMMVRYHETLYTLTYDQEQEISTVTEIFLFDTKLESWASENTDRNQLFKINRNVTVPMYLDNIYVDDQYFYLIGNGTHNLYERGIPRSFQIDQARISRQIHDTFIWDMHKFVIDGIPYLIAVGPQRISDYKIIVSNPSIRCPSVFNLSDSYGEYTLEINATTRSCPAKLKNNSLGLTAAETLLTPCLWRKELKIKFEKTNFIDRNAKGSTLAYIFGGVFVVLCVILIICCCRIRGYRNVLEKLRKDIKPLPSVPEKEFFGNQDQREDANTTQPDQPATKLQNPKKQELAGEMQPKVDYGEEDNV